MFLQLASNALPKGDVSSQDAAHPLKDSQGQGCLGRFWEQHSQVPLACLPLTVFRAPGGVRLTVPLRIHHEGEMLQGVRSSRKVCFCSGRETGKGETLLFSEQQGGTDRVCVSTLSPQGSSNAGFFFNPFHG